LENDNLLKILIEGTPTLDTDDWIEKEIKKHVKGLLWDFDVDFQNIIDNAMGFAEICNREINVDDFEYAFWGELLDGLPLTDKQKIQKLSKEKDTVFFEVKKIIEEYGVKLYMVYKNKMCVSAEIPPNCDTCFFAKICQIKN